MKTDPKARYQGYSFYFREGFCWIDVNSTYLKARLKDNGVFDVLSMSLFSQTQTPDYYWVSMINSNFISLYVDNFINNTSHFQINDARQLPVIIPTEEELEIVRQIFDEAIEIKKNQLSFALSKEITNEQLNNIQLKVDTFVNQLYGI